MSNLTATEVRGMMEAYNAVYAPQQEDQEVQELGIEIIENAAYVLFSQGYNVDDVISYFTEAETDIIVEDFVNFAEGNLLIESVAVSDEYIEEQFQQLDERLGGLLRGAASLIQKGASAAKSAVTGAAKRVFGSRKIEPVVVKDVTGKGGALVKTGSSSLASPAASSAKSASSAGQNVFQKAGNWAKTQMGKISGVAQKVGQSGAGQFAKKVGSRVLPGLGVAAYGADAVSRAKKGDWGGAAISGIGAGLSAIPGVGTIASLAPAAVQMGTDALGLTGDKSKKGPSPKTAPTSAGAPKPKGGAGMVNIPGKGQRYYSSSDKKYYANYNDALAARRSRRGETPQASPSAKVAPSSAPEVKATNTLASKTTQPDVKPSTQLSPGGRRGNADLEGKTFATGTTKGGTKYEIRTPTSAEMAASKAKGGGEAGVKAAVERSAKPMGGPEGPGNINPASVQADIKAAQERDKKRRLSGSVKPGSTFEHYDAYDAVLEYLFDNGHVDTLGEAHYVMMEMDGETIADICEGRRTSLRALSAESQRKKEDKERGRPETKAETHGRLALGDFSPSASPEARARGGRERLKDRGKVPKKGGKDMFEQVLEHLISEGYADTEEAALEIMANMGEEWKQSIIEMGENIGREPKTVGKPERPGIKGETYAERQKRMNPSSTSSMLKPA